MKEVKNKNEFKERDEIDAYFSDAKKRNFPIGIIFVLLILILIGGCAYYYFVLDSPKNIFLTAVNKLSSNIELDNTTYEKTNIDFSLDLNLITNKKDYIELTDIINEMSITGNFGINLTKKEESINIKALYEEKDLFGVTGYITKDTMYMKLDNIFDKVLKDELTEEDIQDMNETFNNYNEENESTKIVIEALVKHFTKTLEEANYTKEYIELDETYVKKLTLIIDKELVETFCDKLLNDPEFMENYSKLQGITESELKEKINKAIYDLEESKCEISLYLSILKNEFIKLEIIEGDYRITLTEENNELAFKYYESSIIKYQGYAKVTKNDSNYQISLSIEDIEEEITIELNLDITLEFDKEIEVLDTTNAIDIDELTEDDYNKVIENITNNQTLNGLLGDFMSLFTIYSEEDNYLQTT